MKKITQTLVTVPHQELIDLKELLEQFASWEEPLSLFNQFFTFQQNQPLNKKKIIKEYYAHAQIFHTFHQDYERLMQQGNQLACDLLLHEKSVETKNIYN